jgi:DNA topoisomerase-3
MAMPASVESYYQEIGRAGRDGAASRAVMLSGWSDRKTHEFFMDREYPAPEVLQRVWDALGDEPRSREELRDFLPRDAERVDAALRKLVIHGGARLDAGEEATRGGDRWLRPYQAQMRHKRDQLDLITQYAGSRDCRMVHLVGHFGDQEDEGHACGQCDVCAPQACVASTFRRPDASEQLALKRLLEDLRRQDGQSSGRLHQTLFGQALDRDGFERLAGALVRAGLVQERTDSFEKDGRVIVFRRLYLTAKAAGAVDLSLVPMETAAPTGSVRRVAKSPKARGATLPEATEMRPADAGLVEALRAWRLEESRRREVPAFCVLSNKTLQGIASARPRDERTLLGVKGVGPKVVAEFGDAILALVRGRASDLHE